MIQSPRPNSIFSARIPRRDPLRKVVYERVKEAILSGSIPKGMKLYENVIAEEMGISRTPVREALHALEREHLIVCSDKVGYEIVDFGVQDLVEISELRKSVEVLALQEAALRIQESDIAELEENVRQSEEVLKRGSIAAFIALDAEFHTKLCVLSRSERLVRMADDLRKQMTMFRLQMKSQEPLAIESAQAHKNIVQFLKTRRIDDACGVLIGHIDRVKEATRKHLGWAQ